MSLKVGIFSIPTRGHINVKELGDRGHHINYAIVEEFASRLKDVAAKRIYP